MQKKILSGFTALIAFFIISGCATQNADKVNAPSDIDGAKILSEKTQADAVKESKSVKGENKMQVKFETNKGDIVVELNKAAAPKTVANFVEYVNNGHYTDTIFHRVINGFMIQGGGFDTDFNQKNAPKTVENEANNGLKNERGTIAMARTSAPHSASAQFFINTKDNGFLNYPGQDGWGYCVFGKVVEGMDIVDEIENAETGNRGFHQDVPTENIVIKSATISE